MGIYQPSYRFDKVFIGPLKTKKLKDPHGVLYEIYSMSQMTSFLDLRDQHLEASFKTEDISPPYITNQFTTPNGDYWQGIIIKKLLKDAWNLLGITVYPIFSNN